jgi:8-oxo-dGTP pyrophosphatase MutT (NUDIX family)
MKIPTSVLCEFLGDEGSVSFGLPGYPWHMSTVEERTSVRVILIDPNDRVLVLGARDPDDGRNVWFLPGGGVEGTESLQDTARRELVEELSLDDLPELRGPVWKRDHHFTWDGREIIQHEEFLVGHLAQAIPTERVRPPGKEGEYLIGAHWLSVDELEAWPNIIAPRRLAQLLPAILAGDLPSEPIDTGI